MMTNKAPNGLQYIQSSLRRNSIMKNNRSRNKTSFMSRLKNRIGDKRHLLLVYQDLHMIMTGMQYWRVSHPLMKQFKKSFPNPNIASSLSLALSMFGRTSGLRTYVLQHEKIILQGVGCDRRVQDREELLWERLKQSSQSTSIPLQLLSAWSAEKKEGRNTDAGIATVSNSIELNSTAHTLTSRNVWRPYHKKYARSQM